MLLSNSACLSDTKSAVAVRVAVATSQLIACLPHTVTSSESEDVEGGGIIVGDDLGARGGGATKTASVTALAFPKRVETRVPE